MNQFYRLVQSYMNNLQYISRSQCNKRLHLHNKPHCLPPQFITHVSGKAAQIQRGVVGVIATHDWKQKSGHTVLSGSDVTSHTETYVSPPVRPEAYIFILKKPHDTASLLYGRYTLKIKRKKLIYVHVGPITSISHGAQTRL